mmetsp:Transcript_12481/g.45494  ORF Transcript_12481/g.45494 Transcript_12481/m.45494 type:complete len:706 (+) Transcript_12481:194-2311(+)
MALSGGLDRAIHTGEELGGDQTPWIQSFCAVSFDLEIGQVLEALYPPGSLSEAEALDVVFSSFPDSITAVQNSRSVRDRTFFFRIRRRSGPPARVEVARSSEDPVPTQSENAQDSGTESAPLIPERFLYGYVFCRQRKDQTLQRGGDQKSVVVLTELPFSNVFAALCRIVGPLYFDIGDEAFKEILAEVTMWPVPELGAAMELHVNGMLLRAQLPTLSNIPDSVPRESMAFAAVEAPDAPRHPLFGESNIFTVFRGHLSRLWTLYELALTGESILVISPSPSFCSEAVAAIVSLLNPVPPSMDFRPYFTIHDHDFDLLIYQHTGDGSSDADGGNPKDGPVRDRVAQDRDSPLILGVTNYYFVKGQKAMNHIVSVGQTESAASGLANGAGRNRSSAALGPKPPGRVRRSFQQAVARVTQPRNRGPGVLLSAFEENLWSEYLPVLKPDTILLNNLVEAETRAKLAGPYSTRLGEVLKANSDALRRHFLELTQGILSDFERALREMSTSKEFSPFSPPKKVAIFDEDAFLNHIKGTGGPGPVVQRRIKGGQWMTLYRRFCRGSNFSGWFRRCSEQVLTEHHQEWQQELGAADIHRFIEGFSEAQLIDAFTVIEQQIRGQHSLVGEAIRKLREDLVHIFEALPKDVQQSLLATPQRAALLGMTQRPVRHKVPGRIQRVDAGDGPSPTPSLSCSPPRSVSPIPRMAWDVS